MIAYLIRFIALMVPIMPIAAVGQDNRHGKGATPYAGLETREIKSLSAQDVEELRRGGGWGLALSAELNGRPGPLHLLELKDELGLSAGQVRTISAIYEDMRVAAIAAGERYIAAEFAIDDALAGPDLPEEKLRKLVEEAADARAALRFIHLSRHLSTPRLLSDGQVQRYNVLRGYSDDPCADAPEGHDPDMWRRHNGCE